MAFRINRQPEWLARALGRAPTEDTGPPNTLPDTIAPVVDIFGWERWGDRVLSFASTAPIGDVSVFPFTDANWPGAIGVGGVTPSGVIRLMYQIHVEHNDPTSRLVWVVKRDRVSTVEIKIPVDTVINAPQFYPVATTRMILLRPGEFMIGRVQAILATAALTIRYAWVDLEPGEYIPHLV